MPGLKSSRWTKLMFTWWAVVKTIMRCWPEFTIYLLHAWKSILWLDSSPRKKICWQVDDTLAQLLSEIWSSQSVACLTTKNPNSPPLNTTSSPTNGLPSPVSSPMNTASKSLSSPSVTSYTGLAAAPTKTRPPPQQPNASSASTRPAQTGAGRRCSWRILPNWMGIITGWCLLGSWGSRFLSSWFSGVRETTAIWTEVVCSQLMLVTSNVPSMR